ncbi:Hypothetical protein FKW44_017848, partial [Caligus rogercresseyi]
LQGPFVLWSYGPIMQTMVCLPQTQEFKIKNGAFIQILFTIPFGKHEKQVNLAA